MDHNVEFKGFEPEKRVCKLIEDLATKVERKTKNFSPDVTYLRVRVEENSARNLYHVSITLKLLGKTLASEEERHNLDETIQEAFAEIDRQLEMYKMSVRGEEPRKRAARQEERRQQNVNPVPIEQGNRERFFSQVGRHLKGLYEFVRHHLAYYEAMGDLLPDELTPEDVVDAVLLRAYREFVKDPTEQKIRSWLIRLAREQLEAEIKRLKSERNRTAVCIEEDIPETPPTEEVSTLDDEILEFYQPDEDLKLEDIIRDIEAPTPEELTETKELRRCVAEALAGLPEEWRRALLLRYDEGLTGVKLAKAIGKSEPEMARILKNARTSLRQKLIELGCRVKEDDSRPVVSAEAGANSQQKIAKRG
jgi:RNA polymerase sigma factor (sigma-70 family)